MGRVDIRSKHVIEIIFEIDILVLHFMTRAKGNIVDLREIH